MTECRGPCDNQADIFCRFPAQIGKPDYRKFCTECYQEIRDRKIVEIERVRKL